MKYLAIVKIFRWFTFNDNSVSLRLRDDPESTSF